jgi:phenylacetate-coenzyme A ligase PaaK-like adenylate-forming protein
LRSVAETLTQDVRDLARTVWNVPIVNVYAATEIGVIGQECEQAAGMHLAEDLFVLEVVDEANRPVPPGVQGAKVLVTPLTNDALPVIRYELSDLVIMADGPSAAVRPSRALPIARRCCRFRLLPARASMCMPGAYVLRSYALPA